MTTEFFSPDTITTNQITIMVKVGKRERLVSATILFDHDIDVKDLAQGIEILTKEETKK
jgi:hypothetical protein